MDIYEIVNEPEKQLEIFSDIIKKMNNIGDYEETLVNIISRNIYRINGLSCF